MQHTAEYFQQLASGDITVRREPPIDIAAHALLRSFQLELFSHAQHHHVTATIATTKQPTADSLLDQLILTYTQTLFTTCSELIDMVVTMAPSNQNQSISDLKLIDHIKKWLENSTIGAVIPSLLLLLSARITSLPTRYEATLVPTIQQFLGKLNKMNSVLHINDNTYMLLTNPPPTSSASDSTAFANMKVNIVLLSILSIIYYIMVFFLQVL